METKMTYYYELEMTKTNITTIFDGFLNVDADFNSVDAELEHVEGLILSRHTEQMIEQNYEKIKITYIDKILKST